MSNESGVALGRHVTVEYYDCSSEILADAKKMEHIFVAAATASGATVLGSHFHDFQPQGVSGFVIIAESHFSVHAWPEHDYAAVDIFTCGESIDFQMAMDYLRDALKSESMIVSSVMSRGIVGNNGIERMVPIYAAQTNTYALAWRTRFDSVNAWGIVCTIDVHDCEEQLIHNPDAVLHALTEVSAELGLSAVAASKLIPFAKEGDSGFNFCFLMSDGSRLSGNLSFGSRCAYVDVFSTRFFEPRHAAELVLQCFRGRHYRMQVAVRR
ncbi:MAG: adenosylmethionine decarboxylase [Victivallaceae bacterium]|nr:adenosylmethionine decarboxylase [Victivallaceae bacterium]